MTNDPKQDEPPVKEDEMPIIDSCPCGSLVYAIDWSRFSSVVVNILCFVLARGFLIDFARVRCTKCGRRWMEGSAFRKSSMWS